MQILVTSDLRCANPLEDFNGKKNNNAEFGLIRNPQRSLSWYFFILDNIRYRIHLHEESVTAYLSAGRELESHTDLL